MSTKNRVIQIMWKLRWDSKSCHIMKEKCGMSTKNRGIQIIWKLRWDSHTCHIWKEKCGMGMSTKNGVIRIISQKRKYGNYRVKICTNRILIKCSLFLHNLQLIIIIIIAGLPYWLVFMSLTCGHANDIT